MTRRTIQALGAERVVAAEYARVRIQVETHRTREVVEDRAHVRHDLGRRGLATTRRRFSLIKIHILFELEFFRFVLFYFFGNLAVWYK